MVDISFSDTGVGIPRELMEKVFDPFFTTRSMGTGLGLPISVQIARDAGGVITAKNNPGGGATLRVSLPVSAEPPGRPEEASS
jgi:two-component system sensor histidine kinase AtoS